jgi:hypothetical protein
LTDPKGTLAAAMDETLSQPLPIPRQRRTILSTLLVALLAFVLGGAAVTWLAGSGWLTLPGGEVAARPEDKSAPAPLPTAEVTPTVPELSGVETRLALLEDRITRVYGEANAASGNAGRAEALLIAYAVRRKIDKGEPLGFVEQQLKLRFGGAQPDAVQTIVTAARSPVTLDDLAGELETIAPALSGTAPDEGTWARIQRELSGLFVLRRGPESTTLPANRLNRARLMLASGQVGDAIAEVERLPGAASAQGWIEAARRYQSMQRALDVIETAAMLEPRNLRDGDGRAVSEPSPLAPPADAPPAVTQ